MATLLTLDDTHPPSSPPYNPLTERLSTPFPARLLLSLTISTFAGFTLGLSQGGLTSGLRFRAENAHRFPSTQTGWYLYHKSKNYHIALGAVREGFRMAGRVALGAGVFFTFEEGIDRARAGVLRQWREVRGRRSSEGEEDRTIESCRDFVSTIFAGLGTAGMFSAWNRFPLSTAVRTAKKAVRYGLLFGVVQDMLSVARGRRVGYVEFVKSRVFGMRAGAVKEVGVAG
ncbi:hypothetical protein LTS14_006626 [Recurvomyces mirabilis]|uniref:uncharacterized protein n=1 Tax=Recurvomyces mirabilis TaxID=574656 RepID=UPI002DE0F30A|nr:hypothetical protein LTS14_006626 [Recurvomyces mirabilis]